MTKTRKTIGVMVGGITDDFTRFLCKGLREAAKEQKFGCIYLQLINVKTQSKKQKLQTKK